MAVDYNLHDKKQVNNIVEGLLEEGVNHCIKGCKHGKYEKHKGL